MSNPGMENPERDWKESLIGDMLTIRYVLHSQHHSETEVYAQLA